MDCHSYCMNDNDLDVFFPSIFFGSLYCCPVFLETVSKGVLFLLLGLLDKEENIIDFATYTDDLCILIDGNSYRELEIKPNIAVKTIIIGVKDTR